jgi:hypothetical protein
LFLSGSTIFFFERHPTGQSISAAQPCRDLHLRLSRGFFVRGVRSMAIYGRPNRGQKSEERPWKFGYDKKPWLNLTRKKTPLLIQIGEILLVILLCFAIVIVVDGMERFDWNETGLLRYIRDLWYNRMGWV